MRLELIAQFLGQYLQANDGMVFPANVDYIKDGISVLLEQSIMTVSEMREEALRDYSVIIPWEFFPKEYQPKGYV